MPFISSSYDGSARRSSGSSTSGLRGLDRFSSTRKSSVYERPSTYNSATAATTNNTAASKYSSLERIGSSRKNGSEDSSSSVLPSRFSTISTSTPTSYKDSSSTSTPFGISSRRDSSTSSYLRSESNNGNDYSSSTYGGGNSNSSTLERSSHIKPASRSNSSNLFSYSNADSSSNDNGSSSSSQAVTDNGNGRYSSSYADNVPTSSFSSRKNSIADISNSALNLTQRINETLSRHGLGDKGTSSSSSTSAFESKPSYNGRLSDNRYSRESRDREIVSATPTGSWRRRHDSITSNNAADLYSPPTPSSPAVVHQPPKWEIPDQHITARKTVISRSTSPVLDSRKGLRTRIARTTDPIVVEQRRSRKPRVIDAECQTETIPEFGTLEDYLHPPPPPEVKEEPNEVMNTPSFDYFARLKQTLMDNAKEKLYAGSKKAEPESESEDDYYQVKKAPMMMLLPGTTSSPLTSPKKLSDAVSLTRDETEEDESEYTYETEEEEEEEEEQIIAGGGVQSSKNGLIIPPDLESYEAKAERVLEQERERVSIAPDLEYIDEEDEDVQPQVTSPKRKKKGTFISGTIDIDDLLAKEQTPTNFALDDSIGSPPPPHSAPEGLPKKHVGFSEEVASKEVTTENDPIWNQTNGDAEEELPEEESNIGVEETEEIEDKEEWEEEEDEEGAGEEEGDWEWEYYEDGEGLEEEEEEEVEEEVPKLEVAKPKTIDEDCQWIVKGLRQVVPRIPDKSDTEKLTGLEEDSEEEEEEVVIAETVVGMTAALSSSDLLQNEMGYKEWLEESAQLHEGAHLHLQAEIEAEEDLLNITSTSGAGGKDATEKSLLKEGSPLANGTKVSKASRLVDKIRNSEDMDLKRVLFSLKTFFQSDKDLVYEFVKEGGLSLLIEFGEDQEAQLQNLILRALGQIMLYVDGMNGVMENTRAIQFLYKLVLASNPLVCKTAIKLLLVFVEYTESNCLLLIKAINAVDKELGVIPWSNIITTIQNANKDSTKRTPIDTELAMYGLTLVNKCLYEISDQDTFYDQTDYMEELNMSSIVEGITSLDTAEGVDSGLMQQVQLYNVALKQEDGEPVTEEEISYLDEDATETGLRTTLRAKADKIKSKSKKQFVERKSLRYKTKMLADGDVDSQGDMAGISIRDLEIILAKNGLPTSRSGTNLNAMSLNGFLDKARGVFMTKISKAEEEEDEEDEDDNDLDDATLIFEREGQAKWDEITTNFNRPLMICDLDFNDLNEDSDDTEPKIVAEKKLDANGIPLPPAPPPAPPMAPPAPPPPFGRENSIPPPPPIPSMNGHHASDDSNKTENKWGLINCKSRKTAKLFWKEIRYSQAMFVKNTGDTIWDDMEPAGVDTAMIEYLFENKAKEVQQGKDTKQTQLSSAREIIVLDHKRSNAINIGMTKLPPPRVIKTAVMKMDSSIMNREAIEKLLTMLPSEEETTRINEAQEAQPDIPLGTAEQFLQTLSSVSCLEARLRLWSFKMEFEVIEKEVCEPLMDLKIGLTAIRKNGTFKTILNVLLTFGNFLNGTACKGFQLDYLEKVPEVKDTVHKHSLLYHMTYWVLETYPASSDLYSEIGPLTRVSRTDFNELEKTLKRMEAECKNAWDYLKIITRHDEKQLKLLRQQHLQQLEEGETEKFIDDPNEPMRKRLQEFLVDAAERIFIMMKVHKRVHKRYFEFLTWMGIPVHFHNDYPVHKTCKILSEFALEYRTTRERVIQTIEKKKAARERKRRDKKAAQLAALQEAAAASRIMSPTDIQPEDTVKEMLTTKELRPVRLSREEAEDSQLRQLLGQDIDVTENGTLRRKKKHHSSHRHRHHNKHHSSEIVPETLPENGSTELEKKYYEEKEHRREKKSRRHRSSIMDGTLPLTEDNFKEFTQNEMERGLLESLMATSDSSTLKRNKERRKSVKERKSGSSRTTHDLKRSRTRENNVLDELETAAEALANL